MHTTSLSDWLSGLSAGMAGLSLICLALSFVDADWADFDPRSAFRRAVESGEWDRLLIAVANAKHAARCLPRDAAVSVAALLMLLNPTEVTR